MKACFQIAECSKSFAKIRIFYQRAYTWFSEVITFIGDLFHSAIYFLSSFYLFLFYFFCGCKITANLAQYYPLYLRYHNEYLHKRR